MSSSHALLEPGSIFAREYKVLRPLRSGGMGSVHIVEHRATGKLRALKLLAPELELHTEMRERFVREARAASAIESEHVVEIISAGIDEESDRPYIVMELLQGEDLGDRIERLGPLDQPTLARVFRQLAHPLGAAHRAGIIHRDLKPENIFLAEGRRADADFTVKLLDFGVAKILAAGSPQAPTQPLGSPLFMAPEQTDADGAIGPGTDVWALGLLAFFLLTGEYFWIAAETGSVPALLREVCFDDVPPASVRAVVFGTEKSVLPPGFDVWFARCLAREPGDRWADGEVAANSLADLLETSHIDGGTPLDLEIDDLLAAAPRASDLSPPTTRAAGLELDDTDAPTPDDAAESAGAEEASLEDAEGAGAPDGATEDAAKESEPPAAGGWFEIAQDLGGDASAETSPPPVDGDDASPPTDDVPDNVAIFAQPTPAEPAAPSGPPPDTQPSPVAEATEVDPAAAEKKKRRLVLLRNIGAGVLAGCLGGAISFLAIGRGPAVVAAPSASADEEPPPAPRHASVAPAVSASARPHEGVAPPSGPAASQVLAAKEPPPPPRAQVPRFVPRPEDDACPDRMRRVGAASGAFCIDETEVTIEAWAACVKAAACPRLDGTIRFGGVRPDGMAAARGACVTAASDPAIAVNCVDRDTAAAMCAFRKARLPRDEEWATAAFGGAGDARRHPWGAAPLTVERANVCDDDCVDWGLDAGMLRTPVVPGSDGVATVAPVGSFLAGASPDKVLDLLGNVAEWTSSDEGADAVVRGGSFASSNLTQILERRLVDPRAESIEVGFRCAADLKGAG